MHIAKEVKDVPMEAHSKLSFLRKRREKMKRLLDGIRLKRKLHKYPEVKKIPGLLLDEPIKGFEYLIHLKENGLPVDLFAFYLRLSCLMDTEGVPVSLLKKAYDMAPRELLMTKKEQEFLANPTEVVTIYRGTDSLSDEPRIAWSMERKVAERFSQGQFLFEAQVKKSRIVAYYKDGTDEEEVVVFLKPEEVRRIY